MIIRFILGDQLSHEISSLSDIDPKGNVIWMCEVMSEATYVKHHKKKIAFLFSAMRHFAEDLKNKGFNVHYTKLDDPDNAGSFSGEIARAAKTYKPEKIVVTFPGEYRVFDDMLTWEKSCGVPVEIREDDRFLCSLDDFKDWAEGRKELRMEYFYREMRKKYRILVDENDKPEGGQWNYDSENRNPPKDGLNIPKTYSAQNDDITRSCLDLVAEKFPDHFGELEPFFFAVTRDQALYALDKFINERLKNFGDYQDAMLADKPFMYHSHLSFYINAGLLLPLEVCQKAEAAYKNGEAPLNAVEGFIRQILGWREYVRGIYWMQMPDYERENALKAKRKLPPLYWKQPTQMNCLRHCVKDTWDHAYAHHIQRLMVLGNFALLCGFDPGEVNEWYLIVYADAYQWVELPNVTGMILYADGGLLGSKPYAASGAYINRMSDYCGSCRYKVTKKNGPDACPFNYLYWNFFLENQDTLKGNPRLNHPYATLRNMDDEKINAIKDDSRRFLKALENNEKV